MAPSRISPPPPSDAKNSGLSTEQLDFYNKNGYLIIPNALDPSTVSSLLAETKQMLDNFSLSDHPMTKFSTGEGNNNKHVGDDYFLTSGDKIRFFFEEGYLPFPSPPLPKKSTDYQTTNTAHPESPEALSPTNQLLKPAPRAINKIGHYLHTLSAPFRTATLTAQHASIARSLQFRDPRVLQSMVICKQPEVGGAVPPHQDSSFLYTDPPSAVGFWIALEDASGENGCLSFARGSQRRVGVGRRFVRVEGGTGFVDVEGGRFPRGEWGREVESEREVGGEEMGEYTLGEVKAGTLVLIHGNLLHKSERNTSSKSRFIYTFHVIEGENEYDERNWLQPPEGGFTRLYQDML
ncbi:MAG: hypothetical protein M1830_000063 [Pleopsidium flavum]|nr:MAG: hypothetical protein M1830_000063 [Pleopsidium flavum]